MSQYLDRINEIRTTKNYQQLIEATDIESDAYILAAIAKNKISDENILNKLLIHNSELVLKAIAENKNSTELILLEITKNENSTNQIFEIIAEHENTTTIILETIFNQSKNMNVFTAIASNNKISEKILEKIALYKHGRFDNKEYTALATVLLRKNISIEAIRFLATIKEIYKSSVKGLLDFKLNQLKNSF